MQELDSNPFYELDSNPLYELDSKEVNSNLSHKPDTQNVRNPIKPITY